MLELEFERVEDWGNLILLFENAGMNVIEWSREDNRVKLSGVRRIERDIRDVGYTIVPYDLGNAHIVPVMSDENTKIVSATL